MSKISDVEDQLFAAVQAAADQYLPQAHFDVRLVEPEVRALAEQLVAGAEAALSGNTISGAAAAIGTTIGAAAGTAAGSAVFPGLGSAIGATAGGAIGGAVGTTLGVAFSRIALQLVQDADK